MKQYIVGLVACAAVSLTANRCHAQDSLERALLRQAPALIKYFQKQGYKNVGVLKFLAAQEGAKKFVDNVGPLNLLAARRLELALILANDPRAPIGIVENASATAHKIPGASHMSKVGREKLFAGSFPLAWGKETAKPDAFVTGTAEISKDLRKLNITLLCFDRMANKLVPFGEDFQVVNSTDRLAEIGESFVLRGVFDDGKADLGDAKNQEKVFQEAVKVHDQESKHPAQSAAPPVTLDVYYDDVKVPLEYRDGRAYIAEPREGQKVEFYLNRDATKERYGVVLKVNGENTLEKERQPDIACHKWVLDNAGPWAIRGYYVGNMRETFRVASVTESREREVNYGHDVGTITMTVFRERKGKAKPKLMDEAEQYQTVVTKVAELPERPKNYSALKAQLLDDANRGIIVEGDKVASNIETVAYVSDPNPIMSMTIVYYRK